MSKHDEATQLGIELPQPSSTAVHADTAVTDEKQAASSPPIVEETVAVDETEAQRGHRDAPITARMWALYDRVTYTPKRCRYDPAKPFEFSLALNVLFGRFHSLKPSQT
jgi:hypothetical protein